ncbi:SGNH/GDSL hydrolase family protein [Dokdonella sp.]|uniref:SGNH/GDSL hydrolase family protein n=1 Tax=Dokdonella sp. TaxID=2291710 RepID=UPI002F3FC456
MNMRAARGLRALLCVLPAGMTVAAAAAESPAPRRALFVGNSLVYYNDLPRLTATLAAAANAPLEVEMIAGAGTTMREHLERGTLRKEFARTHYDIVVLQDRGGYPSCARDDHDCAGSVAAMCEAATLAREAGARPVWFGTWQGIAEAQAALSKVGARAAKDCDVAFADVGAAMQRFLARSRMRPWLDDGHPDVSGSWVAAAVLARAITNERAHVPEPMPQTCRVRWQDAHPDEGSLASAQQEPARDCTMPSPAIVRGAVDAANRSR